MLIVTKITSLFASELAFYAFSYSLSSEDKADGTSSQARHFISFHIFLVVMFFVIPCLKFLCMYEKFSMFVSHCFTISIHSIKGIILLAKDQYNTKNYGYSEVLMMLFAGMGLLYAAAVIWNLGIWFDFEDPSFDAFVNFSTHDSVNDEIKLKRRQNLINLIPCIRM